MYTPQTWADGTAGGTPLSAARLNNMEAGIAAALTATDVHQGTGVTVEVGTDGTITISANAGGTIDTAPPGSYFIVNKDPVTGFWPSGWDASGNAIYTGGSATSGVRPTARADITIVWRGADPPPTSVTSGTGGPLRGVDERTIPNA